MTPNSSKSVGHVAIGMFLAGFVVCLIVSRVSCDDRKSFEDKLRYLHESEECIRLLQAGIRWQPERPPTMAVRELSEADQQKMFRYLLVLPAEIALGGFNDVVAITRMQSPTQRVAVVVRRSGETAEVELSLIEIFCMDLGYQRVWEDD